MHINQSNGEINTNSVTVYDDGVTANIGVTVQHLAKMSGREVQMRGMSHQTHDLSAGLTCRLDVPRHVCGSPEEIQGRTETAIGRAHKPNYLDFKVPALRSVGASELGHRHITGVSDPESGTFVQTKSPQRPSSTVGGRDCISLSEMHGALSPTN